MKKSIYNFINKLFSFSHSLFDFGYKFVILFFIFLNVLFNFCKYVVSNIFFLLKGFLFNVFSFLVFLPLYFLKRFFRTSMLPSDFKSFFELFLTLIYYIELRWLVLKMIIIKVSSKVSIKRFYVSLSRRWLLIFKEAKNFFELFFLKRILYPKIIRKLLEKYYFSFFKFLYIIYYVFYFFYVILRFLYWNVFFYIGFRIFKILKFVLYDFLYEFFYKFIYIIFLFFNFIFVRSWDGLRGLWVYFFKLKVRFLSFLKLKYPFFYGYLLYSKPAYILAIFYLYFVVVFPLLESFGYEMLDNYFLLDSNNWSWYGDLLKLPSYWSDSIYPEKFRSLYGKSVWFYKFGDHADVFLVSTIVTICYFLIFFSSFRQLWFHEEHWELNEVDEDEDVDDWDDEHDLSDEEVSAEIYEGFSNGEEIDEYYDELREKSFVRGRQSNFSVGNGHIFASELGWGGFLLFWVFSFYYVIKFLFWPESWGFVGFPIIDLNDTGPSLFAFLEQYPLYNLQIYNGWMPGSPYKSFSQYAHWGKWRPLRPKANLRVYEFLLWNKRYKDSLSDFGIGRGRKSLKEGSLGAHASYLRLLYSFRELSDSYKYKEGFSWTRKLRRYHVSDVWNEVYGVYPLVVRDLSFWRKSILFKRSALNIFYNGGFNYTYFWPHVGDLYNKPLLQKIEVYKEVSNKLVNYSFDRFLKSHRYQNYSMLLVYNDLVYNRFSDSFPLTYNEKSLYAKDRTLYTLAVPYDLWTNEEEMEMQNPGQPEYPISVGISFDYGLSPYHLDSKNPWWFWIDKPLITNPIYTNYFFDYLTKVSKHSYSLYNQTILNKLWYEYMEGKQEVLSIFGLVSPSLQKNVPDMWVLWGENVRARFQLYRYWDDLTMYQHKLRVHKAAVGSEFFSEFLEGWLPHNLFLYRNSGTFPIPLEKEGFFNRFPYVFPADPDRAFILFGTSKFLPEYLFINDSQQYNYMVDTWNSQNAYHYGMVSSYLNFVSSAPTRRWGYFAFFDSKYHFANRVFGIPDLTTSEVERPNTKMYIWGTRNRRRRKKIRKVRYLYNLIGMLPISVSFKYYKDIESPFFVGLRHLPYDDMIYSLSTPKFEQYADYSPPLGLYGRIYLYRQKFALFKGYDSFHYYHSNKENFYFMLFKSQKFNNWVWDYVFYQTLLVNEFPHKMLANFSLDIYGTIFLNDSKLFMLDINLNRPFRKDLPFEDYLRKLLSYLGITYDKGFNLLWDFFFSILPYKAYPYSSSYVYSDVTKLLYDYHEDFIFQKYPVRFYNWSYFDLIRKHGRESKNAKKRRLMQSFFQYEMIADIDTHTRIGNVTFPGFSKELQLASLKFYEINRGYIAEDEEFLIFMRPAAMMNYMKFDHPILGFYSPYYYRSFFNSSYDVINNLYLWKMFRDEDVTFTLDENFFMNIYFKNMRQRSLNYILSTYGSFDVPEFYKNFFIKDNYLELPDFLTYEATINTSPSIIEDIRSSFLVRNFPEFFHRRVVPAIYKIPLAKSAVFRGYPVERKEPLDWNALPWGTGSVYPKFYSQDNFMHMDFYRGQVFHHDLNVLFKYADIASLGLISWDPVAFYLLTYDYRFMEFSQYFDLYSFYGDSSMVKKKSNFIVVCNLFTNNRIII